MQSHTFASPTNQRSSQSLQKSVSASTQNKIQNIFSCPSKKIKTPDTQTNPTKTVERSVDNDLQTRTTERQLPTAVLRNGGCSASYDSFVVGSSAGLPLNLCSKNPPLPKAANRYKPF
ncbi:MAG: hypothetical protein PHC38_07595 [Weeksellaceae bacterium]|nr:hypothetical protein [Weeksellaceae bacterium]